jgi:hypothetical protein
MYSIEKVALSKGIASAGELRLDARRATTTATRNIYCERALMDENFAQCPMRMLLTEKPLLLPTLQKLSATAPRWRVIHEISFLCTCMWEVFKLMSRFNVPRARDIFLSAVKGGLIKS